MLAGDDTERTVRRVGHFTSLALDGGGIPVVSSYDVTNADLGLLRCGNATCTAGNSITTPDASGDVGAFSSLALDALGNPMIAYGDATARTLNLMRCESATCTAPVTAIMALDTMGPVAGLTSLASRRMDAGRMAGVAYYDATARDLKVARCGTASCLP